jgi:hypothetical protein
VRVVDEHVRRDGLEGFRNRREVLWVGACDAGDQLEVVRGLDRARDGPPGPAGDSGHAHPDHAVASMEPSIANRVARR